MIPVSERLLAKLDVPGPRYTSYPAVPDWSDHFDAVEHRRALEQAASAGPRDSLSLYVHVPFCREMCSYCGCNVVVARHQSAADGYLEVLAREARLVGSLLGGRNRLSRVHLGGGTPTFLDERQLIKLWDSISSVFQVEPGAELAVEINPVWTTAAQIALLGLFGFNRLSIGVQDLDPGVQESIGRVQTIEQTWAAVEVARGVGFESINMDLIYGLPRQTEATMEHTVRQVIAMRPNRVALFSFAYVPSLKPHQRRLPVAEMPGGPLKLALFQQAADAFEDAGYQRIGFDHFALPEDPLARAATDGTLSRDFQGYTVERAPQTIGLGPSAISDLGYAYAQIHKSLRSWRDALDGGCLPTSNGCWLSSEDRSRRALIRDLMCNFRVTLDPVEHEGELVAMASAAREGLVELDGTTAHATPLGRLFVRNLAMLLDPRLRADRVHSRAV
jgi:oxygen-independent coproporphyrinogen III oxidase